MPARMNDSKPENARGKPRECMEKICLNEYIYIYIYIKINRFPEEEEEESRIDYPPLVLVSDAREERENRDASGADLRY